MAIETPYEIITGRKDGKYPITSDIDIRMIRGRITPCDGCKRRVYCAMYQSFTRHRMRSQYAHGSNILHHCMIYVPDRIPGNISRTAWPEVSGNNNANIEDL